MAKTKATKKAKTTATKKKAPGLKLQANEKKHLYAGGSITAENVNDVAAGNTAQPPLFTRPVTSRELVDGLATHAAHVLPMVGFLALGAAAVEDFMRETKLEKNGRNAKAISKLLNRHKLVLAVGNGMGGAL